MRCTPSGELNSYDEPLSYVAYSPVYNHTFRRDECVLIRNNLIERPTNETVLLFASRLTETERTIDVNVKAQKTPNITQCDEKTRLSLLNIWNQYNGNEPLIVADKSLNPDAIKVFKTDAPYVVDKLQIYKQQLWNEVLTFFGINNANNDKRERLITDEVNANNEVIDINADVMLLTRQKACEDINAMYGLNVSVEMRNKKEESEWQDTPLNSEQ
jgi:hypothetical protein